ncbi:MAG TPA: HAD hydrolase family protein [Candidatus Woesebacteria bacterium]|nr:HAD hydrolase family protein [Candidatus Woesebacteria bacterium]
MTELYKPVLYKELSPINDPGIEHCKNVLFAEGEPIGDIITDLDGTILSNGTFHNFGQYGEWEIPEETVFTLRAIRDSGIGLSAITGKTWEKAEPIFKAISAIAYKDTPMSSIFNRVCKLEEGGVLWDPNSGEISIQTSEIDLEFLKILREHFQTILPEGKGDITHTDELTTYAEIAEQGLASLVIWEYGTGTGTNYTSLLEIYQRRIDALKAQYAKFNASTIAIRDIVGDGTFSIVPKDINKATITESLTKTGKVAPLNRTIFLCNGINDVALAHKIKEAGGGVICPDDAYPELLPIADYIGKGGAGYGITDAFNKILS